MLFIAIKRTALTQFLTGSMGHVRHKIAEMEDCDINITSLMFISVCQSAWHQLDVDVMMNMF